MGHLEFDRLVAAYKTDPTPTGLQALLRVALYLEPEPAWQHVRGKEAFSAPFLEIQAVCDRILGGDEVRRFAGCLGYAMKATLAGQELGDPFVCYPVADGRIAFTLKLYQAAVGALAQLLPLGDPA